MKTGGPGSGPRHRGGPAEHKAAAKSLIDQHGGDRKAALKFAKDAVGSSKKFGDEKNANYWKGVRDVLGGRVPKSEGEWKQALADNRRFRREKKLAGEAGPEPVYVKKRYPNIKPEGEIDPRDFPKQGKQGGGHAGGSESEARKPMTMEGKRGWTERQRAMHSKIGKRIARSN